MIGATLKSWHLLAMHVVVEGSFVVCWITLLYAGQELRQRAVL